MMQDDSGVMTTLKNVWTNSTEREKRFIVALALMAVCIIYLAATNSPVVVVQPAQPAAQATTPSQPVIGSISPIVREKQGDYSAATIEALKLQSGDLEIGKFNIYIDPETRCQYVRPMYREGLTPRLRKDGQPMCGGN
jgi:hypothetical protein